MILLKGVANHTLGLILVLHLFLYRLQAKNDVYIFKWLEEKRIFYEIVSIHKILLEHNHAYSHPVCYFCATMAEPSSWTETCKVSNIYHLVLHQESLLTPDLVVLIP